MARDALLSTQTPGAELNPTRKLFAVNPCDGLDRQVALVRLCHGDASPHEALALCDLAAGYARDALWPQVRGAAYEWARAGARAFDVELRVSLAQWECGECLTLGGDLR